MASPPHPSAGAFPYLARVALGSHGCIPRADAALSFRSNATLAGDFTDILIRKRIISPDQLGEAKRLAKESGKKVADELVRLGYASGDEVMRAVAQEHGLDFVNLKEVVI